MGSHKAFFCYEVNIRRCNYCPYCLGGGFEDESWHTDPTEQMVCDFAQCYSEETGQLGYHSSKFSTLSYGLNFRLHTRIGFMKTVATVITSTTGFWMPLVEIERAFSALPMQRLWLRLTRVHSTTPCHTYTINLFGTIATRTSMGILQGLSRRRRRESMENNVQFLVGVVTAKVENHNKFLVTVFEILYTV